jgi:hypothetical protein
MYPEITVVCAVAGHPDFLPKLNFPSDGYSYTGHRLMANIQDRHDAQCSCATRIHNAWTVELKASELGPVLTKIEMGDDLDERIQLLSPLDIMWERIPSQPEEDIVSIVCDARMSRTSSMNEDPLWFQYFPSRPRATPSRVRQLRSARGDPVTKNQLATLKMMDLTESAPIHLPLH